MSEKEALQLLNQIECQQNVIEILPKNTNRNLLFKFKPTHLLSFNKPCINIIPASPEKFKTTNEQVLYLS